MKTTDLIITQTYKQRDLKIGFKKVEDATGWWADYYYVCDDRIDGPYADEKEAFGGWYRWFHQ